MAQDEPRALNWYETCHLSLSQGIYAWLKENMQRTRKSNAEVCAFVENMEVCVRFKKADRKASLLYVKFLSCKLFLYHRILIFYF